MKSSVTSKETGTNTRRRSITSNKSSNSRPTISRFFRPHKKFKERNEAAADDQQHHRTAAITLATPGCEDGRPGPGAAPSSSGAEEGVEEEKEATNKEHTATTVPVSNNRSTFAKADSVIELLDDDVDVDDDDSMEDKDKDKDDENENDAQTVVVAAVVSGNSGITTHTTTTGRRPRGATAAAAESSGAETPPDDPEKEATENEKARTPVLHNPFAQFAYHTAERSTKEEEGVGGRGLRSSVTRRKWWPAHAVLLPVGVVVV